MRNFKEYCQDKENGITTAEAVDIIASSIESLDPWLPDHKETIVKLCQKCGSPWMQVHEHLNKERLLNTVKQMKNIDILTDVLEMVSPGYGVPVLG